MELGITIDKALKENPELKTLYDTDEQAKYLIDMSKKLEGLPRHTSMHAAGVLISPEAVDEFVPLSRASDGTITTQYTMTTLEELGLLKMDFLGLRTLTVIQDAAHMAKLSDDTLMDIDFDDKNIFDMISSGKCEGVFQLESAGMKQFMTELKPKNLEEVIAGISLYRPGPMDFIPEYIAGKNNADSITYDCPQLEPILKPTYGCIVYQEQVMEIVRSLAGYSYGRSDLVRRAMSKKKTKVMEAERQNFVYGNEAEGVKGCVDNGIPEKIANKIYDDMIDFAKYAFNKSHAAAYAVVAYQTAYLKYYYPVEFMAALLTSVKDNAGKVLSYIMTSRKMGINILPPDINSGYSYFSVSGNSIRYGMSAIKGIGSQVIDAIVKERETNGSFTSMKNFMERLSSKEINRHTLEGFIKSGALDSVPGNRRQKMIVYESVLESVNREKKDSMTGQLSLFDFGDEAFKSANEIKYPDIAEFEKEELLAYEKEYLNVYISGHPLEDYLPLMEKNCSNTSADFEPQFLEESGEAGLPRIGDKVTAVIGGMITAKTVKTTKTNTLMAFITVEDLYGSVEVVIFPRDYENNKYLLEENSKIFVRGRTDVQEGRPAKLICQKIIPFDKVPCDLWVRFASKQEYVARENELYSAMLPYDGNDGVWIYVKSEETGRYQRKHLPPSRNVDARRIIRENILKDFGEGNVGITEKSIEK